MNNNKIADQTKKPVTFEYTYIIEGVYSSMFVSRKKYDNMSAEEKESFLIGMRNTIIGEIEYNSLPIYDIKVSHTGKDISYPEDI